jgi:hypothetical protein
MLDHIGWNQADLVLPSLIRQLCNAQRSEELNSWRHPVDLTAILRELTGELPNLLQRASSSSPDGFDALVEKILGDDPSASAAAIREALKNGMSPLQLSRAVTYAAALRIARFHTQNEIGDWIAVLHTFTYCNALHQAIRRTGSTDLLRGVFHGAMRVYLDRFLNIPPAHLPGERGPVNGVSDPQEILDAYLDTLNTQQQVEPAARLVYRYLTLRHPVEDLFRAFAESLLREDADFHSFQMLEAGIRQYEEFKGTDAANHILIAVARYLAAHAPTQRALNQTARIAMRLHRGEALFEE